MAGRNARQALGRPPTPQEAIWIVTDTQALGLRSYLLLLALVVAPLAEEVMFRGLALPALARRLGGPAAVLLVALVFALLHFHLHSLAALFTLGVALAWVYIHTGTLWAPVTLHALFNGVNLGLLFWLRAGS